MFILVSNNNPSLYYMKGGFEQMDIDNNDNTLQALGFDDGDLEMVFYENPDVSSDQLIQIYLEISREDPFNLAWQSVQDAIDSPIQTSALKPNGTPFTKHDIVKVVLDRFDEMQHGGYKRSLRKPRKIKRRKTRKTKKTKRRRTRRH